MNLTKPSERLYLSYARVSSEGKGLRPSYLIDTIKKLFPTITIEKAEEGAALAEQIVGTKDGLQVLAGSLRADSEGNQKSPEPKEIAALLKLYKSKE